MTQRGRKRLTICGRGHDLTDPANIITFSNGQRSCRKCRAVRALENYYERKRATWARVSREMAR